MGNSWFQFKQFRVNQDRCAMKISTDAVMLGALVEAEQAGKLLEIGAGTGVISLMLAQRFPAWRITALEIDEAAADQCAENFSSSPFANRLDLVVGAVQSFETTQKFDRIVSNPPYYPDHLKPKDERRLKALHTDDLSFEDLLSAVEKHLHELGEFWLVLPPRQMEDFRQLAAPRGLGLLRLFSLADRPGKSVHRQIAAFSRNRGDLEQFNFYLKEQDGTPSAAYRTLLTEFFLDF
ncbi:tRNA1(Val) (adenine(37)-N6)-methyltransferase [Algoriphagus namhaensis]